MIQLLNKNLSRPLVFVLLIGAFFVVYTAPVLLYQSSATLLILLANILAGICLILSGYVVAIIGKSKKAGVLGSALINGFGVTLTLLLVKLFVVKGVFDWGNILYYLNFLIGSIFGGVLGLIGSLFVKNSTTDKSTLKVKHNLLKTEQKKESMNWVLIFRLITLLSLLPWFIGFGFLIMLYDAGSSMTAEAVASANGIMAVWWSYPIIFAVTFILSLVLNRYQKQKLSLIVSSINPIMVLIFILFMVLGIFPQLLK